MAPPPRPLRAGLAALAAAASAVALDNGLARTPPMGYNTWFLNQAGNDAQLRATADAMLAGGFLAAGYDTITIDDLWSNGRDANSDWVPIASLFPNGTQAVLEYMRGLGFKVGQYTCRGTNFCGGPDGTGSEGFEVHDGLWFGQTAKVDLVKSDSCNAPSDEPTAFHQYALMRDALNASGRPIVFSLCGWNPWYAPTGAALGNMWRIGPDGGDWGSVLTDIDFDAPLWPYAGPGAWNDPDELGGCTWCGSPLNALQRRAQFSVYAALAAPLLLSIDLPNISAFDRATYLNAEAIAISQDPLGKQAVRVAGGDLLRSSERLRQRRVRWGRGEFVGDSDDAPGVALQPCTPNASDARGLPILEQQWALTAPQRQLRSAADGATCAYVDGCGAAGGDLVGFACHEGPGAGFAAPQQGYLTANNDAQPPAQLNVSTAKAQCLADEFCLGITFASSDPTCNEAAGGTCLVYFKNVVDFGGDPAWTTLLVDWPASQRVRPHALEVARRRAARFDAGAPTTGPAAGAVTEGLGACCANPGPGEIAYCNTQFAPNETDGTLRSGAGPNLCLTAPSQVGSAVFAAPCVAGGSAAQLFFLNASDNSIRAGAPAAPSGLCLSVGASPTSVWLKELADGSYAIAALNAGKLFNATAVCAFDDCLGKQTGWLAGQALAVKDVWGGWLANTTAGAGWTSPSLLPAGGHALHRLVPIFEAAPARKERAAAPVREARATPAARARTSAAPAGPWDAALIMHTNETAQRFNAYCLDGSKGGFYYRAATTAAAKTKWKLHFCGGGWSTSPEDLLSRSQSQLGSSSYFTPWLSDFLQPHAGFYGLMSMNDTRDNIVGDFNFVWFAYCDGTSQTSDLAAPLVVDGKSVHLRGRALLDAHLAELDARFDFSATATEVIVSGTSAGGLSTHLHAPLFAARLPAARVVAVPDAGFWWNSLAYGSTTDRPWIDALTPALPLWNFSFNPQNAAAAACLAAFPSEPVKCFTQPYQSAFSPVPTFTAQSLYDTANLGYCFRAPCSLAGNAPGSCSPDEVAAIQAFAGRLRASIEDASKPGDGFFLSACSQHETTCQAADWFGVRTPGGASMNSTFAEWYSGGVGRSVDVPWPGDDTCASITHGFC